MRVLYSNSKVTRLGGPFEYINKKNKNLEKLFSENKTSPLLKTPEKDFQNLFEGILGFK